MLKEIIRCRLNEVPGENRLDSMWTCNKQRREVSAYEPKEVPSTSRSDSI